MFDDEAPTQRIYRTAVGPVDYDRASACAQAIAAGHISSGNYICLSALFESALFRRTIRTSSGDFDEKAADRLMTRLRKRLTTEDLDAMWRLLFALFDRTGRHSVH